MLGSVTPEGTILLTFIPTSGGSSTIGLGRIVPHGDRRAFEMQMSTGTGSQTTAHWAFMVPVEPGDPNWDSLPGFSGLSVTEMLDGLEPPTSESSESGGTLRAGAAPHRDRS